MSIADQRAAHRLRDHRRGRRLGRVGPFTRRQALDAGVTLYAIKQNVALLRWLVLHPRVFCEASAAPSLKRDASAAVLAAGPGAALSHLTAGTLWELDVPFSNNRTWS